MSTVDERRRKSVKERMKRWEEVAGKKLEASLSSSIRLSDIHVAVLFTSNERRKETTHVEESVEVPLVVQLIYFPPL